MYVDGSSTLGGSGAEVLIINLEGDELEYAIKLDFKASNNEPEYEALVCGLELAGEKGINNLSRLVVHQVCEKFEARDERMIKYVQEAKRRMSTFHVCHIVQVPREENEKADFLARMGSSALKGQNRKINRIYTKRKGPTEELAAIFEAGPLEDWRMEIINCLKGRILVSKREQAQVEAKSRYLFLKDSVLYKYAFSNTLLRCLGNSEAKYVLREMHEGYCGDHARGRTVPRRLLCPDTYGQR